MKSSVEKMCRPHVIAIPYPAQGHVIPLMELCQCLVKQGFKVTFVNTEFNHRRVLNALAEKDYQEGQIRLVSVPDGLEPWEDRNDLGKLSEGLLQVLPGKLEELIDRINASEDEKITGVISDQCMAFALEVAQKMNISRRAIFWPASTALLASIFSLPNLIADGIIESSDGTPLKKQMMQLAPGMPLFNSADFVWCCVGDLRVQRSAFKVVKRCNKSVKLADWIIGNSAFDLEPGACSFAPEILPIGPLLARNRLADSAGHFWQEDLECLKWLDQQQENSVIYVAFGSFTVLDQTQFQELALGLELTNRPFLWAVRPDITNETDGPYPNGFRDRVASRGRMVGWAPQQKVLSHPSVACFLSHCGWNSTLEGVVNGIPFLCWPYFADQFLNESYICDIWKVGLRFNKNENGIIYRQEIKNKVEQVLDDEEFKARASELKGIAMKSVGEGGDSYKTLKDFVNWLKA